MIDLHGYHVHEAWRHFNNKIDDAYYNGMRKVVVTGQGAIMREQDILLEYENIDKT